MEMDRFRKRYRHELKYLVDDRDIALLDCELKHVMKQDIYNADGAYRIRSVYFDDCRDSALYQNIDGVSPRAKFRIRTYNENRETMFLEKKIKNHDLTGKRSCPITFQECEELLRGRPGRIMGANDSGRELLLEFTALIHTAGLKPKVIVEYERTAYVCREGNVRVTFDRNIASSGCIDGFLDARLPKRPVLPSGRHVLEVKYDEFFPRFIRESINTGKMERATFSKYVLCRQFCVGRQGGKALQAGASYLPERLDTNEL